MEALTIIIEDALINERTKQRRLYSAAVANKNWSQAEKHMTYITEINKRLKEDKNMKNLNEMKAAELKEMAKELHISNWWNMKKKELIKKIEEAQGTDEEVEEEIAIEEQAATTYTKNWGAYTRKWLSKSDFLKAVSEGKIVINEAGEINVVAEELKLKAKTEEKPVEEKPVESEAKEEEPKSEEPKEKKKKTNLKIKDLTYKGETKSIREWAEQLEMPWPTLYDRVNRNGWTVEEAIETPLGQRRPR